MQVIVRVCKDKNNPYVSIPWATLQAENISLKARGLLAYLLSMPDDWRFIIDDLSKVLGEHRQTITKLLTELESAGFCKRKERQRNADGTLGSYDMDVYDVHVDKMDMDKIMSLSMSKKSTLLSRKKRRRETEEISSPDSSVDSSDNSSDLDTSTTKQLSKPLGPSRKKSCTRYEKLGKLMAELLIDIDPDFFAAKDKTCWVSQQSQHLREIVETDKRDFHRVELVAEFALRNPFWQTVIESAADLRKQYHKIHTLYRQEEAKYGPADKPYTDNNTQDFSDMAMLAKAKKA